MGSGRVRSPAAAWWTLGVALAFPSLAIADCDLRDISLGARQEDVRVIGRDAGDEAGSALAVGDVTGDGIGDLVIGVPSSSSFDNGRPKGGEVAVIAGGPDLLPTIQIRSAEHTFFGTADARLGSAVAVGDIDGDGAGDIIMGAPHADAPPGGEGAVFVYYGGQRLPSDKTIDVGGTPRADVTIWGAESGSRLGRALVSGDFNADGIADIAIAAPGEGDRLGRNNAGVVYVFFGARGLERGIEIFPAPFPLMAIRGPATDAFAGSSLAAGDVNGDGIDDIVIGATPTGPIRDLAAGLTFVVFGGAHLVQTLIVDLGDPRQVDLRVSGPAPGDRFGWATGVADINGDGTGDLLVGAPASAFAPGIETGRAFAIFGRPFQRGTTVDLALAGADVMLAGPHDGADFGASISGGDMNGDGIAEWVVGSPLADRTGQAYRILGRQVWSELGVPGCLTQGARFGDRTGTATAIGDVTADGVADLVVSSPSYDGTIVEKEDAGAVYVVAGIEAVVDPTPSCVDADSDGFRMPGRRACGPGDCDDARADVNPTQPEICGDLIDNDCDGFADGGGIDLDGDGWPGGPQIACVLPDCDDNNAAVNPGAAEVCGDTLDNNCDGIKDLEDPRCVTREVCDNCLDDDGDGVIDVVDTDCQQAEALEIQQISTRRARRRPTVIKSLTVSGMLSAAPFLADPAIASRGATIGLAISGGGQSCVPVARGRWGKGRRSLTLSADGRRPTTLRLRQKRDGRVLFSLEVRGGMQLPGVAAMTLSVGLFPEPTQTYRGAVEIPLGAASR